MALSDVAAYIRLIDRQLRVGDSTESSHRPALKTLIETLRPGINATNEPKRVACGAPDFAVAAMSPSGSLTIGHIETKDIGANLAAIEADSNLVHPSTVNGEQLKRYRAALPNLLVTDYVEFRWYVDGIFRACERYGAVGSGQSITTVPGGTDAVQTLILDFLNHATPQVSTPHDLADRMARLTHLVRDIVQTSFHNGTASDLLKDLKQAFVEVLIPALTDAEFADMYAQTITYGLFAARVHLGNSSVVFRRTSAASGVPKTNPFLRRLFGAITGPDLDDEPYVGFVDDIVQLMATTDISAVLADFGKRQRNTDPVLHFYETFLSSYDSTIRTLRGVYYTPEPVVSYIIKSVDKLLTSHFSLPEGLRDATKAIYRTVNPQGGPPIETTSHRVLVLDPACGTGTFLYSIVDFVRDQFRSAGNAGQWKPYVSEHLIPRLFGFELLMAPYAVAHLKLGLQLAAADLPVSERNTWAYDLDSGDRLNVFLTNSLEDAVTKSQMLIGRYISDEANSAAKVKRDLPIMVVLGNPPYAGLSANLTPNARALVDPYRYCDGVEIQEKGALQFEKNLQNDYVKFMRFAEKRIEETGAGIVAMITSHKFLRNPTLRGMRNHLLDSFDELFILDLHGGSIELSPKDIQDRNVFDIEEGVSISIFVRLKERSFIRSVKYAELWGSRESKADWLSEHDVDDTPWMAITPQAPQYRFIPSRSLVKTEFESYPELPSVFVQAGIGIVSARDNLVVDTVEPDLIDRIKSAKASSDADAEFCERFAISLKKGWRIAESRRRLRSVADVGKEVIEIAYRPFDRRHIFYHSSLVHSMSLPTMRHLIGHNNVALVWTRPMSPSYPFAVFSVQSVGDQCLAGNKSRGAGVSHYAPLYAYPAIREGETRQAASLSASSWTVGVEGRVPNFKPAFIQLVADRLGSSFVSDGRGDGTSTFGPEDLFDYLYAVLSAPSYRARFEELLREEYARVPLTSSMEFFDRLAALGVRLRTAQGLDRQVLRAGAAKISFPIGGSNIVERGFPKFAGPGEVDLIDGSVLSAGRIYLSRVGRGSKRSGQFFSGVPRAAWEFEFAGYRVVENWLLARRGRPLTFDELEEFKHVVAAVLETIETERLIDAEIKKNGGWPII